MEKASSSHGRASDTDMRNLIEILRYLRGNPGIMTVRPTTLNLEALKRSPVGSVLTYGDSDWAGDADRLSVSGTATWLRGKLRTRSQRRAEKNRRSHSAVAKPNWLLHSLELVKARACDNSGYGYCNSDALTRRRLKRHNRSCAVIPLRRWV